MTAAAIASAYLLDLATGLAPRINATEAHPVRFIGRFISAEETFFRRAIPNLFLGGALLFGLTAGSVLFVCVVAEKAAFALHPAAGFLMDVTLVYFSISPETLAREGMKIYGLLKAGDDAGARRTLSMIVGRDTEKMPTGEAIRACVETLAENGVDGMISPLFFAAIGGGPLAMTYRAVNTLDSMVGHRDERYEWFGKVSARLDDAANFIPARISIVIITAASFILRLDAKGAFFLGLRDRLKHPSPNSAHPEAAFAGALGVGLGGANYYGGIRDEKPRLGDGPPPSDVETIPKAAGLLRMTALLTCVLFTAASFYL
ncbi:MAG: cobalamin biosynthesis protein CobD [Nitrospinae bacterium]|nr:cobalamin biosynthesis protein CobD [Nitrospinota bacterium]